MSEVVLCDTDDGVSPTTIHHPEEGPLTFPVFPTPTSAGDIMPGPQPAPPPFSASIAPWQAQSRVELERLAKQASILPGMS